MSLLYNQGRVLAIRYDSAPPLDVFQTPGWIIAVQFRECILQFLRPDLYLTVLDHATADFKDSARLYLDRADAILQRESGLRLEPRWTGVAARLLEGKPRFVIAPPDYMTNALAAFVRARLTAAQSVAR